MEFHALRGRYQRCLQPRLRQWQPQCVLVQSLLRAYGSPGFRLKRSVLDLFENHIYYQLIPYMLPAWHIWDNVVFWVYFFGGRRAAARLYDRGNIVWCKIFVVLVFGGIKYYATVDFYMLPLLFSFLASLMPKQRTIDVSTTLAGISHTLACPGVDISTDSAPKK